ncbi:FGGY carbohydrate kinase domain-containing protein [Tachyglossus aculeatus]|uniref:FGGY carbohydrate kinase domain-containing protein n=1 Tax=Tachyglossus aculeatus TaxID=9261 RepID=UPI0018F73ABD|nr:FGGY carbohydrate kinase domain-containing protein [Tachyglossus aculeatus]
MAAAAAGYYVGVDVGTGSVRAAVVDPAGAVVAHAERPIRSWEPRPDHHEQSSRDIWRACCDATRTVAGGVPAARIRGLGFDATCSLVVLDGQFRPLPVNVEGEGERNVVMWSDHRAASQVARINGTHHPVLAHVGGVMSVEMQPPKLLWIKENLREACWERAAHFFDLPDFLTWKATGVTTRSLCSLVCKWMYSADKGWDDTFWQEIGLGDLVADNYRKIGTEALPPGAALGGGLTPEAAAELGLPEGIAVAASLIDAHAGALGVMGAAVPTLGDPRSGELPLSARLALVCGTSSCHLVVSESPIFVPGVWGPYLSALVPGLWLNEGGQSATGKLIDHVVQGHRAFPELRAAAAARGQPVSAYLNDHLRLMKGTGPVDGLTRDLHVWPDFHGNRSPLADATLKGTVSGLRLSHGLDDLALLYLATVQAIALGTRHILDAMRAAGHAVGALFLCGGLSKNPLFVQVHADVTGLPVILPEEVESVLVGAAILGARASGDFLSLQVLTRVPHVGRLVFPLIKDTRFYNQKYRVFLKLVEHQREYAAIMEEP